MRSAIAVAAALALTPIGSEAVPISDLFAGGSLSVGTFEVYDWDLYYDVSTKDIDYDLIDVDIVAIDYGFRLDYDFDSQMVVDAGDSIDIDFTYFVIDHGRAHFTFNWLELTDPFIESGYSPGYIAVQEDLFCGTTYIGSKYTDIDPLDGTDQQFDSLSFLCKDQLWVEKHIELLSRGDLVQLGDMHQGFVPVPATLALLGAGLIGLRRGRRQAR